MAEETPSWGPRVCAKPSVGSVLGDWAPRMGPGSLTERKSDHCSEDAAGRQPSADQEVGPH